MRKKILYHGIDKNKNYFLQLFIILCKYNQISQKICIYLSPKYNEKQFLCSDSNSEQNI